MMEVNDDCESITISPYNNLVLSRVLLRGYRYFIVSNSLVSPSFYYIGHPYWRLDQYIGNYVINFAKD